MSLPVWSEQVYKGKGWVGIHDWIEREDPISNKKEQDFTLGEKIIAARRSINLTRQGLAKKIGMNPNKLGERESVLLLFPQLEVLG